MGWFTRKSPVDPQELQRSLAAVQPLIVPGGELRAVALQAGMRGTRTVAGVEVSTDGVVGWFHLDEFRKLLRNGGGIVETWNGSPQQAFLASASAAAAGSDAHEALAGVPDETVALLHAVDSGLQPTLLLGAAELDRIGTWLEGLPSD